jgi:predicted DNA-binding protein (MmcQ/YjbR family)
MSSFDEILAKLRTIASSLPEVKELLTWGHPTFRAGKRDFAVLDEYEGELGVALKVGPARRDALLADDHFQPTPYSGHRGWVTLRLGGPIDWTLVDGLVREAYRQVALDRMIKAMGSG